MQEVSEQILLRYGLPNDSQLLREKAIPPWMVGILQEADAEGRAWWHVYLDNFAAGEIVKQDGVLDGDKLHEMAEAAWKAAGVISSEKKRKRFQLEAEELGAYFDGNARVMGASPQRLLKLIQATLWLLHRPHLSKRLVQVIVGRWIHVFQFRRPAMGQLSSVWDFVSNNHWDRGVMVKARQELFGCICLAPLLYSFLGSQPVNVITASDASSKGGAVGISRELTRAGQNYVDYSLANRFGKRVGILVISTA